MEDGRPNVAGLDGLREFEDQLSVVHHRITLATGLNEREPPARCIDRQACVGIAGTALAVWPELRPAGIHAGLWGLAVNVSILVVGSLALGPRAEGEPEFLETANG